MTRRTIRILVAAAFVGLGADFALAGLLPGPFEFSFFPQGLTEFFLLPFSLAGCT